MPTTPIFQLFGRSPIRPLQEHMDKVYQCTKHLIPFFEAARSSNWLIAGQAQADVTRLEHEADELKHDIRQHLPHGFFLPAPRTDLLLLLAAQDKIANKAKDIAGLVFGRKMAIPEQVADNYLKLVHSCIDTVKQAHTAINELDALLEAGFRSREATYVHQLLNELDKTEHLTDTIQVEVRLQLFDVEKNYHPIDMMFLYMIIEWTGDLANRAQKVGGQLEIILAR